MRHVVAGHLEEGSGLAELADLGTAEFLVVAVVTVYGQELLSLSDGDGRQVAVRSSIGSHSR
jgi:hypothetical protein